jgi:3-deoxy-D-manno-octulosonic-acid transferase
MYLLYSLLLTIGFIVLLPRFAIDAFRTRKYVTGLAERLGSLPRLAASNRPLIWVHCVSVGETEAARPLVRALRERFPSYRLAISTTTVTGQKLARRVFADDAAAVFYFPIDWQWTVRRVLRALQPAAVLIMETELWPNLLRTCRRQEIPVALVNGRISAGSFRRYQKIRPFVTRMLNDLAIAVMQSEQDVARIRELGLAEERTLMCGNLKFDNANSAGSVTAVSSELRRRFGFNQEEMLLVAASTHWPEERVVIDSFKRLQQSQPGKRVRLLIAPRHPERFNEVAELLDSSGLSWKRRSAMPGSEDLNCDAVLLDSIGELRSVFSLADIAFIGGSLVPHGGHNVLEPAAEGVCVIAGAHTDNFTAVINAFLAEDALVQLRAVNMAEAVQELTTTVDELLRNEVRRQELGRRAVAVCDRNRGATERTMQVIADLVIPTSAANDPVPFTAVHLTAAK